VVTNITGKKKNEEKLLLQYEYFKQLFENSPLGIVILDNKTKIIQSNKGFEKLFYYSSSETKGKYLKDLILPEELKNKAGSLEKMLIDGKKIFEETLRKRKDSTIINVERICYPISINNQIVGLCVIFFDITERKKAEIAMKVAKDKAEQSEKLKSDFLAQMSHEIRTPINSMLNFINLIREEVEDGLSEDLKSAFYYIDNGSRRLIRTIDLILNMSQVQNNTYVTELINLDLFEVIIKPIFHEFVNKANEKSIYFNLKYELPQSEIFGDYYTLSQSFQNLIDNAIKFTKTGGVDVVIYRNEKNLICVDEKDTGIGISENYLSKLFEPFTQEETGYTRRFEGNGLGLALVKKYIEINKAAIFVKSEKGVGSTFTITFAT
jgi:PAS domain S-box-containing protein